MTVSLCITSYDKDIHYIHRLLPHIYAQSLAPDEIILFCSGIDSLINIEDCLLPIKIYTQKERCIQSRARNFCAKQSTGDIIIFFDIDDIPHPQKIEATKKYIDPYDFLLHSYTRTVSDFENIDLSRLECCTELAVDKLSTNIICKNYDIHHAHIAVKRQVFTKVSFNQNLTLYRREDGKFCQDLLLNDFSGIFINYPFVIYT